MFYPKIPEEAGLDAFTKRQVRHSAMMILWSRGDYRAASIAITIAIVCVGLILNYVLRVFWFSMAMFGVLMFAFSLYPTFIFRRWYTEAFREALGRRIGGVCVSCGYNTATLPGDVACCPECGSPRDLVASGSNPKRLPMWVRNCPRPGDASHLDDRVWIEVAGEVHRRLFLQPIVWGTFAVIILAFVVSFFGFRSGGYFALFGVVFFLCFVMFMFSTPRIFRSRWESLVARVVAERRGEICAQCGEALCRLEPDATKCPVCGCLRVVTRRE